MKENFPTIINKYQEKKNNIQNIHSTHVSKNKRQKSTTINYMLKQIKNGINKHQTIIEKIQNYKKEQVRKSLIIQRFVQCKQKKISEIQKKIQKQNSPTLPTYNKIQKNIPILRKLQLVSLEKPPQRQKTAMCLQNNKIYLYGGIGCDKNIELSQFDLQTLKWRFPLKKQTLTGKKYAISSLLGHTFLSYKGFGYVYGGFKTDVTSTLQIINFKTFQIAEGSKCIFRRRDHAGVMLSKYMFIHGGIQGNQVTNDLYYYDTQFNTWGYFPKSHDLPFLSQHSMATAFINKGRRKITSISDITDSLYIFGGKDKNGNSTNNLFKINIENQVLIVEQILLIVGPQKRFATCFHHLKNGIILLYGGKRQDQENAHEKSEIFNDVYTFNSNINIWSKIQSNDPLQNRYGMASVSNSDKIYIFGGFVDQKFSNANISILNYQTNQNLKSKKKFESKQSFNEISIQRKYLMTNPSSIKNIMD